MPRMIFVNLPVADLPKAMGFWRALGFDFNLDYTDETAACLVLSDTMFAMLLTHEKFRGFAKAEVADTSKAREVLIALTCETREEVDRLCDTAAAEGGAAQGEPQDHGFMYFRAFTDPDGHVWELTHFPEA
ncbi:VOC family protein [Pararhodobacter zhoushanensis]|uniref:VOC family protein n=1 Tax=Pararhodobacter zhoushanensis TaxID=2479545 RepID=UPI000F8E33ED|nr:VOC family protein [Pararhodobacter zhoushanensis]